MKHTKGEWKYKQWEMEGIDFYHVRAKEDDTALIATIHRWKGHIDKRESLANAKLITAAPEMYKDIVDVIKTLKLIYKMIKDKKAQELIVLQVTSLELTIKKAI